MENQQVAALAGPAQALLGRVGLDAHVPSVFAEGSQNRLGKVENLEDAGEPGVVLSDGPSESTDARVALLLHEPVVAVSALPRGLLVHPVSPTLAFSHRGVNL